MLLDGDMIPLRSEYCMAGSQLACHNQPQGASGLPQTAMLRKAFPPQSPVGVILIQHYDMQSSPLMYVHLTDPRQQDGCATPSCIAFNWEDQVKTSYLSCGQLWEARVDQSKSFAGNPVGCSAGQADQGGQVDARRHNLLKSCNELQQQLAASLGSLLA